MIKIIFFLLLPVTSSAQIYEYKDETGAKTYSDQPPPPHFASYSFINKLAQVNIFIPHKQDPKPITLEQDADRLLPKLNMQKTSQ